MPARSRGRGFPLLPVRRDALQLKVTHIPLRKGSKKSTYNVKLNALDTTNVRPTFIQPPAPASLVNDVFGGDPLAM